LEYARYREDSMTTTTHLCAREPIACLESRAIALLTDEQAFASFHRWQAVLRGAKSVESLKTAADVSEYVAAIFEKVPA
jgi:hypothetical protein